MGGKMKRQNIFLLLMILFLLNSANSNISFKKLTGDETGLKSIMIQWGASWPWGLTLIDYNNDDKMDIIATNHGVGGAIIKNISSNNDSLIFCDITKDLSIDPAGVVLGGDGRSEVFDWNGDGFFDIANFSDEQTLKNMQNQGGSTFVELTSVMRPISHLQDIRDINGDGYLDLLSIKGDKYYNPTTGEFTPQGPWSEPHPRSDIPKDLPQEITDILDSYNGLRYFKDQYYYLDFDRDGIEDVLVTGYANYSDSGNVGWLLKGDNNGGYRNITISSGLPATGTPIGYFDFNNDGYLDIVYMMGNAPGLYLSDGVGEYALVENGVLNMHLGSSDPYCQRIVLADFDNDVDADLIAIRPRSCDTKIFENIGDGNFELLESIVTWDNESIVGSQGGMLGKGSANVFDFNSDGRLDILYGGPGTGKNNDIDVTISVNTSENNNSYAFIYPKMDAPNLFAAGAFFQFYESGAVYDIDANPFWIQYAHPNGTPIHLGLGNMTDFDILVTWPDDKTKEMFTNVSASDNVIIQKGGGYTHIMGIKKENQNVLSIKAVMWKNNNLTLMYELPSRTNLKISLFNLKGRFIDYVVNSTQSPGLQQVNWKNEAISSGVYLVQIQAESLIQSIPITVLK